MPRAARATRPEIVSTAACRPEDGRPGRGDAGEVRRQPDGGFLHAGRMGGPRQRVHATLNLYVRLVPQAEVARLAPSRKLRFFGIQALVPEPGRVSWDHAEALSAVNQTN